MTQVVASTPHAPNGAPSLPYIPASSPSLWAELPSLPCSVEALSQKHKQVQEHHIDLARPFDDEEAIDRHRKVINGADEATLSPSSRAGARSATTSVDSEVRGPAPMRDPFELFDVGSPWTQVNISTQWQRRLWLGKATGGDPCSDDAIDAAIDEPRQHRERRHKQRDEPMHESRQAKKRRQGTTSETVIRHEQQDVCEVPMRRKKTRLAVEVSDENSDEEQSKQAGPSVPRRPTSPSRPDLLPQAKASPLQRTSAPAQQMISPPRAAAQTPRPRPKPRVSSVRAPASAAQTPHALPPGTADSEDDAPSATQFFTRKKRRRVSAEYGADQVEGREVQQRAVTPMSKDTAPSETPGLADEVHEGSSTNLGGLTVTNPEVLPPPRTRAESQASDFTPLSADVANLNGFPTRALNDRTVSFGQLSKDDEDALESFVEGMDSEDDDDAEGMSGGQAIGIQGAAAIPVASGEAFAGPPRPPSPRRNRSRTSIGLRAAGSWLSASPSPPPLIEDYDDDDDPSVPSGLAPLLPDLDEEKRRGYFAQFDSLLGRSAAGSRSLPRSCTSATAWADERAEDEGVGIEWPTTPSARFGGSAAAAGKALGRAESDSRLLPNRFTGFSRPIVSCSQLLAADDAGDGDETALDSPSTRRDRPAGNNDSRNSASITITGTGDRAHLIARSRNAAGMGLVRKTWGTTWREDGTRLVRGRVVRRADPPPGLAVLGAVGPRKEREMWADDVGRAEQGLEGQGQAVQAGKRSGSGRPTKTKRKNGASER